MQQISANTSTDLTPKTGERIPRRMKPSINRIRELREARGWTGDEFAPMVPMSAPYLSQIETGQRKGGRDLWARIAAALGVLPEALTSPAPAPDNFLPLVSQNRYRLPLVAKIRPGESDEVVAMEAAVTEHLAVDYEPRPGEVVYEVPDDSMAPALREGDRLIILPASAAKSGTMVVAECLVSGGPPLRTMKIYHERNGMRTLAPLTARYRPVVMDARWSIVGVVAENRQRNQEGRYEALADLFFGAPPAHGSSLPPRRT